MSGKKKEIGMPVVVKSRTDLEIRVQRLEDRVADLIHFIHYRVSSVGTFEGYLVDRDYQLDREREKKEKLK